MTRRDFEIIASFTEDSDQVLDLGCAKGDLLAFLREKKKAKVKGIERDFDSIIETIEKGISVYRGDIEEGLSLYPDGAFDLVILSRTIQELNNPDVILSLMLKKGKKVVVTFLNFGYFKNRFYFFFKGKKPRTEASPNYWPLQSEIKPLSVFDFEYYAKLKNIRILKKVYLSGDWKKSSNFFPNLFYGVAIYLISK